MWPSSSLTRKSGAILDTLFGRGSSPFRLPVVPSAPSFSPIPTPRSLCGGESGNCNFYDFFNGKMTSCRPIGLLQVASHVLQKHLAGEQETHWEKTNKEFAWPKMVIFFVCYMSCPSALSLVWLQTELDSTQSYYHYEFNVYWWPTHRRR